MRPSDRLFRLSLEQRRPDVISGSVENRTIDIVWLDGHQSSFDWEALRWACPCAICRGEGGQPGMLHTATNLRAQQTEMVNMLPVGDYAMNLRWADGHETGIYPWEYLRTLCPCSECEQKRPAAEESQ